MRSETLCSSPSLFLPCDLRLFRPSLQILLDGNNRKCGGRKRHTWSVFRTNTESLCPLPSFFPPSSLFSLPFPLPFHYHRELVLGKCLGECLWSVWPQGKDPPFLGLTLVVKNGSKSSGGRGRKALFFFQFNRQTVGIHHYVSLRCTHDGLRCISWEVLTTIS